MLKPNTYNHTHLINGTLFFYSTDVFKSHKFSESHQISLEICSHFQRMYFQVVNQVNMMKHVVFTAVHYSVNSVSPAAVGSKLFPWGRTK